jgi:helix-turn-helix protein
VSDAPSPSDAGADHGAPGTESTTEGQRTRQAATEAAHGEDAARRRLRRTKSGESIVVDFVANFVAGGSGTFEPVKGRVLMSDRRLILATSDSKTVVPLMSVFDVAVGQVPPEVEQFFDHTVMVGYVVDGTRRTTVVGGDRETIEKFSLILYRATLHGSTVALKHPAKIGGRLRDEPIREVGLYLETDRVTFLGTEELTIGDEPFGVDLGNIVFFEVLERIVKGEQRLVLSVQHVTQTQTVTTEVSMQSRRKMNILGRYLRQMYHYLATDVRDMDVSDEAFEVLVGLYSIGSMSSADGIDLAEMLDIDEAALDEHLHAIEENGLIESVEPPYDLTPHAQFLINERFEDVNF